MHVHGDASPGRLPESRHNACCWEGPGSRPESPLPPVAHGDDCNLLPRPQNEGGTSLHVCAQEREWQAIGAGLGRGGHSPWVWGRAAEPHPARAHAQFCFTPQPNQPSPSRQFLSQSYGPQKSANVIFREQPKEMDVSMVSGPFI
jgi:hypothetical protein